MKLTAKQKEKMRKDIFRAYARSEQSRRDKLHYLTWVKFPFVLNDSLKYFTLPSPVGKYFMLENE
jgi:hypothetical protein